MTTVDRALLVAACAFFAGTATLLLAAPAYFYATIPGVAASGPMNLHLLRDVGITYAVLATGLALALRDVGVARVVTIGAALYLSGHALLHAATELTSGSASLIRLEAPGIYIPPLLAVAIAWRFVAKIHG